MLAMLSMPSISSIAELFYIVLLSIFCIVVNLALTGSIGMNKILSSEIEFVLRQLWHGIKSSFRSLKGPNA